MWEERKKSLPVWERGLKHGAIETIINQTNVAPRVGAWIETPIATANSRAGDVAPRVGAWIETSHSPQGTFRYFVAPRVGAWIETPIATANSRAGESLPVWERGLKLLFECFKVNIKLSLPVWERGLKLYA